MPSSLPNPKTVLLLGVLCGVALFLIGYVAYTQTQIRIFAALGPFAFALIGGAMLWGHRLAKRNWLRVSGKILAKEGFDPTRLTLAFSLGQTQHIGILEEDTTRRVGDTIAAYVNPTNPKDMFSASFVFPIMGAGFLLIGLFAASLVLFGGAHISLE
ncbi:DUF3592 domain-containing protein [Pseudotabrizicola sp. L79]|uniref:DUF3592 domain-containing protein n=1 Tax=Pseudotabrizicola sp. L79 TaxID=3118402 RepID=UPI002F930B13